MIVYKEDGFMVFEFPELPGAQRIKFDGKMPDEGLDRVQIRHDEVDGIHDRVGITSVDVHG